MFIQHVVDNKIAIEGHKCPAHKGRIMKYPCILCSLCLPGQGGVDIVMTEEAIDEYNREIENKCLENNENQTKRKGD